MRSEQLPHFTQYDPPPKNYTPEKVANSAEIEDLTKKFLSNGGLIQQVDHHANRNPQFIIGNVIRPK